MHRIKVKDNRLSSTAREYNYRWQKVRKMYLNENPLCVECLKEGRITPAATTVDHIEPHRGDYDKFWDEDNMLY